MSPLGIVITIIVIILLLIFLRYVFSDPYTLQNLQNGQSTTTISASTLASNGSNIPSTNFAYSVWFYVNDWNYRYGQKKVIFGRMSSSSGSGSGDIPGVSGNGPCPAVVLEETSNNLDIYLTCFPGAGQTPVTGSNYVVNTCNVTNIPIQTWVNLIISVYGRSLDVYINGKLSQTCILPGVAIVNNSADIFVTPSGGFSGWTGKLQYYPNPLNPQEAWNTYYSSYSSVSNAFSSYQVQLSLLHNGTKQSSITI
jgi:hypothetical protein